MSRRGRSASKLAADRNEGRSVGAPFSFGPTLSMVEFRVLGNGLSVGHGWRDYEEHKSTMTSMTASEATEGLTDEQIAQEQAFMKGLPRLNWGALFMAPVWGPAHGMWATFLYYPLWIFVDNCVFAAVHEPSPLSVSVAVLLSVVTVASCVVFAIVSQPLAAHRAESLGVSRAVYLRRERIWAVAGALGAAAVLALATWYNLCVR